MTLYRFDDYLLNPATRELHQGGDIVALPARAFDCLAYLVEHRERAVGRDELISAVWGRVEVSEALLSHTIVKLRRSLGDTGSEQRLIRTVPRFGYRWTGDIAPMDANGAPGVAAVRVPSETEMPLHAAAPDPAAGQPSPRQRRRPAILFAAGMLGVGLVLALAWWRAGTSPQSAAAPPVAATQEQGRSVAAPALVLPAEVDAADEWRWLRLGLMDLVATRLRDGALPTLSSEAVVALLRTRGGSGGDPLHDASLARTATLRVLPRVRQDADDWEVRLEAFGAQREFGVVARSADPFAAAREAADRLLHELGRRPGASAPATAPALEHLLQHAGAAMLADQLDEALALVEAAPPELQAEPRVQFRLAQIDLRRGDYPAVEQRLHALLDGLDAQREGALRARVLITLAAALVRQDQAARASEFYEEAIALRREAGDPEALGVALLGRGVVLAQARRFDDATSELSRARMELEAVGDNLGVASVDVNLGEFQLIRHRPADALPGLVAAADAFERLGAREGLAHALQKQVLAHVERVDAEAATATSQRFWPPEQHTSNLRMRWSLHLARAEALAAGAQAQAALELLQGIRERADPRRDAVVRAGAEALAARLAWTAGELDDAREAAVAALLPALEVAAPDVHARTRLLYARILRAQDEPALAAAEIRRLRESAGSDPWLRMQADLGEAEQAWSEGRRAPALDLFALALGRAGEVGTPGDLVDIASAYVGPLVEASQLDTARAVGGRIARWVETDLRAARAMANLYRAIGQDAAARKAERSIERLSRR